MPAVLKVILALFLGVHCCAAALRFDMGTSNSVVHPGWTRITAASVYSTDQGYGWLETAEADFDDPVPVKKEFKPTHPHWAGPIHNDVLRDGVEDSRPLTFRAEVPDGTYVVTVTCGRYRRPRHDLNITINDQTIATNLDAWGYVWGSQGGTPTRTVTAILNVTNNLVLNFTYRAPGTDRWREYAFNEPQGGKLWYLMENKNSVLGIQIVPYVPSLLSLIVSNGVERIVGKVSLPAVEKFNRGEINAALNDLLVISNTSVELASAIDAIAGSMAVLDRKVELQLIARSEKIWSSLRSSPDPNLRGLAEIRYFSALRYRLSLEYLEMFAYTWANKKTGLRNYDRFWSAFDLCGGIPEGDPLYFKALLMRGRIANWCGREGHWKNCYDLASAEFAKLKLRYPKHPLVLLYTGSTIPSSFTYERPKVAAPEWALLQHEALSRYLNLIHYWVNHRQSENGELGGGWGDDVEILRGWASATLAVRDPIAMKGIKRLVEGLWASGDIENGFSKNIDDVEHAAELTSDTLPIMCMLEYGNPTYLERCLETMKCMRDIWTRRDSHGHLHFRSHYFSSSTVETNIPRSADVALNGRAVNPGLMLLWYNRHPEATKLIGEWARSWIEDAFSTNNNKPAGFLPGSISFPEHRFGGYANHWWETKDYFSDFQSIGYTATLWETKLALFAVTGDPFWMSSLQANLAAVEKLTPNSNRPVGSAEWAAHVCDSDELAQVFSKWKLLSNNRGADTYLKKRGSAYVQYLLTGQTAAIEEELQKVITGLSSNLELSTSEVLFTDRVNIPGSEILYEMMTGGVGAPTYYPLHAITWENTSSNVATFVTRSLSDELHIKLFNFTPDTLSVTSRLWRLVPGQYKVAISGIHGKDITIKNRGAPFAISLPPAQETKVSLKAIKRFEPREESFDLALDPNSITIEGGKDRSYRISVVLHNLGIATSPPATVTLFINDKPYKKINWSQVSGQTTFEASTSTRTLNWRPSSPGTFKFDLRIPNQAGEKTEDNNSATLFYRVR